MEGARRCSNDHLQHTLKAALQLPSSLCCKSTNQKVATPHSNASLPGSIWSYCMYLTIDSNHFHFKRLKSAWTASRPACTYLKTPVLTRHAGKESRVWQQNMKPSKWAHTGSIGYPWVSKNLMVEIVLLYLIIYHYYYIIMIIISYYILSSCSPRKQLTIAHHFEDFPRGYRGHVWPWNLPPRSLWYQTL